MVSWGPACMDAAVQSTRCCCVGGLRSKSGFSRAPHHYKLALWAKSCSFFLRISELEWLSVHQISASQLLVVQVWMQRAASGLHGTSAPAAVLLPPNEGLSARSHPVRLWGGCSHWRVRWHLGFILSCLPKAMVRWAREGLSRSILRSLFIPELEVYVLCAY